MLNTIKQVKLIKRLRKNPLYTRMRQYSLMAGEGIIDDRDSLDVVDVFTIHMTGKMQFSWLGLELSIYIQNRSCF